jgi:hypothetical protein
MSKQSLEEIYKKLASIEAQLNQLTGKVAMEAHPHILHRAKSKGVVKKGVGGGLANLIGTGFLDKPKSVSEIIGRLKQDGHYYEFAVVATKLLRMVRGHELTRIRDGKKWNYVTRK